MRYIKEYSSPLFTKERLYRHIEYRNYVELVGGDYPYPDYSNCCEFTNFDKILISKFLKNHKRGLSFKFHEIDKSLSDTQIEWQEKNVDDVKRKVLIIQLKNQAIEVQKLDDDWYVTTYISKYGGPRMPERYLYQKCDQIDGLISLINSFWF